MGSGNGGVGLESNESTTYCVTPTGTKQIRGVLVHGDYPGTEGAELATVNDLDLIAGYDDASKITGNFKTLRDYRNTAEHVIVEDVRVGETLYFQVRAREVPQGPQPYAFVVIGEFENAKSDCTGFNIQDNFERATEQEFFPYDQVAGTSAAMMILGIIVALIVKYMKERQ